ncbi:uncharacterized protein ELE39_002530 [Cryptosporidium sp. chipmunk genotype I]|uniref:uncharacterized protein n=1 Tax=Cryptosporidium sp. chipmunk genotype I TaxID=1280935 RepID=UPI003519FD2F|nr:hypothetical protein ELE39_002530 [Cryptosporidium sp. chipmunk genotype I]
MRIRDRLLICIIPFLLIFGTGLYNNRSISDFEVFSRRYWDFTRFISSEFNSPYYHFLIGLTVIINRGLIGGDELVSNIFEFFGTENILIKVIKFLAASPPGTPTLTILFLILTLCKFYSICANSTVTGHYEGFKFQNKDVIIENLDYDLGKIIKGIVKNKQNKSQNSENEGVTRLGGFSAKEILGLENSVNTLSHISSEITESLYNFISAFHVDQTDFPDSNELSNFKSETFENKLQSDLIARQNGDTNHDYNNQLQSPCPSSVDFPVQNSQNIVSYANDSFSTHNNGKLFEKHAQNGGFLDEHSHQGKFSSEVLQTQSSGNEFNIPTQTINSTEVNKTLSNPELYIDHTFLQDINTFDINRIEYSGGDLNTSTTYEFNSNIYSSLI